MDRRSSSACALGRRDIVVKSTLTGVIAATVIVLAGPLVAHAQNNPLAPFLEVPGAQTTLPIDSAKSPFSLDFVTDAQDDS